MADQKITELTADASPTSDDLIPTVNDPGGTPANKKVTLANAITKAHGLGDSTVVGVASGVLTSGTDVAVVDGGTGSSTAAGAATNLGLGTGDSPQFTAVNIGHATDTTIARVSAGVVSVEGATVVVNAASPTLGTITTTGTIELGHASDTTIARSGAGAVTVEGVQVILSGAALGTPASGTLTNCTGLPVAGITASTTTALGVGSVELGHASDTTIARSGAGAVTVEGVQVILSGAALGTPASGTLTNCTGLPVAGITASTATALGVGSIELGHASDTTIARSGAGAVTVEGVQVILSGAALGTPASGTLTNCTALPVAGITASTATALGVGSVELGHASDTTIARVSAGVASIEGVNILTVAGGLLTGPITLGENTSIALDPAGSADGKYSGITVTATGGAVIAFGDLLELSPADGRWELASVSAAAGAVGDCRGLLGMAVTSSTDGGALTVLLNGIIRADANFPTFTVGAPVYATTAGDVTGTQPTTTDHIIRVVGFATTADEIYFNPSPEYITHT